MKLWLVCILNFTLLLSDCCFFSAFAKSKKSIYLTANTLEAGEIHFSIDRFSLGITNQTMVTTWGGMMGLAIVPNLAIQHQFKGSKTKTLVGIGFAHNKQPKENLNYLQTHFFFTKEFNKKSISFGAGAFLDPFRLHKSANDAYDFSPPFIFGGTFDFTKEFKNSELFFDAGAIGYADAYSAFAIPVVHFGWTYTTARMQYRFSGLSLVLLGAGIALSEPGLAVPAVLSGILIPAFRN